MRYRGELRRQGTQHGRREMLDELDADAAIEAPPQASVPTM